MLGFVILLLGSMVLLPCIRSLVLILRNQNTDNVEPGFKSVKLGLFFHTIGLGFVVFEIGFGVFRPGFETRCWIPGSWSFFVEAQLTSANGNAGLRTFITGLHGFAALYSKPGFNTAEPNLDNVEPGFKSVKPRSCFTR